ncbi:MAG TPA: hypothetical protein VJN92_04650 [Candidatus Acidoferrum sp.]|nr:hypothetical protein [Candidatus Acidoferrum sp.]
MKEHLQFSEGRKRWARATTAALFVAGLCLTGFSVAGRAQGQGDQGDDGGRLSALIRAERPLAPCTPNETAVQDVTTVSRRGDVVNLPDPLKTRLLQLAARPHTYLPIHAFAEAVNANGSPKPSQLFQYYLIDTTGFQPNIFTTKVPGINDNAQQTAANQANCAQPSKGAVRLVVEPKPGLPTDPNDPRAFIDIFTDVSGLFVINNESGWYEGWMIHDVVVPQVASPRIDGSGNAPFGTITAEDAAALKALGTGNNVPGNIFTVDGNAPHLPSAQDHFPDIQTNTVSFPVSLGTFNAQQQSDVHAYWEFNHGTDWSFPTYELPFTGGIPPSFQDGQVGAVSSIVPGSGPAGVKNNPVTFGDNPDNPRDPDRADAAVQTQRESRLRFIPSGLNNEVHLDVFLRVKSFEPNVPLGPQRFFDAYAKEVARVDRDGDGVVSFEEADIDGTSDGLPNTRLYLPATAFDRYAMTREINDGLLAPRFAPGQRGYVQSGLRVLVTPAVPASAGQDSDNR